MTLAPSTVIPAQAGTHGSTARAADKWTPTCIGVRCITVLKHFREDLEVIRGNSRTRHSGTARGAGPGTHEHGSRVVRGNRPCGLGGTGGYEFRVCRCAAPRNDDNDGKLR